MCVCVSLRVCVCVCVCVCFWWVCRITCNCVTKCVRALFIVHVCMNWWSVGRKKEAGEKGGEETAGVLTRTTAVTHNHTHTHTHTHTKHRLQQNYAHEHLVKHKCRYTHEQKHTYAQMRHFTPARTPIHICTPHAWLFTHTWVFRVLTLTLKIPLHSHLDSILNVWAATVKRRCLLFLYSRGVE